MPNEQALVNQRGLPQFVCQAMCYAPDAGGLSPQQTALVQPPYEINNGLMMEPLNTKARGRGGLPHVAAAAATLNPQGLL